MRGHATPDWALQFLQPVPAAPDPRQRQSHQTRMAALLWSRRRASPIYAFIVQSWDTAAKTSELNDYSVCPTWGVERENYYLIDVFRRRLNYPDLKRAIVSHAERFDADKIVIEGKSSGTQLIQDLQNDGVWKVVEYKPPPGADKVMRLHACSDRFESGRVVLPRNAPWLDEYILELIGFPGTKHDDQVDSTTQALDYLREPDLVATYVKAFLG